MASSEPYLTYWLNRQEQQKRYNQQLAQQARQDLQKVVDLLLDEYNVTQIILFGSLCKGTFNQESDIDLAVAGIPAPEYFHVLAQVNSISQRWIDLKPLEELEPHFKKRVLQTGEYLYASTDSE